VGIPARYVSGLAYTNWEGKNGWGPHAWAEVYFPGYGWVAYDITYGQFGYVDATHIKLKESVDSKEPSTLYIWKARSADIKTRKLEFSTSAAQRQPPE
jgi:transglutaminase-like putative cysteine protease